MKKSLLSILLSIFAIFSVSAQATSDPTSWGFSHKSLGQNEYELTLTQTLQPGWHTYSMYTPEGGAMATSFTFENESKGITLMGKAKENEPHKAIDKIFGVEVWSYGEQHIITLHVKIDPKIISVIEGTIDYQVCNDGQCVVFDKDFSFKISDKKVVEKKVETTVVSAEKKNSKTGDNNEDGDSLWMFFWFAFVAGLAAVIMPCVFPMIPMTVSFFMHGDSNKAKARAKALFFAFSIVVIYTVVGLIISFFLGADFINWLSTNWVPNILFFVIFMAFAASFFGAFEIVLPSWMVNKSDAKADKGGYMGAFFMAFTLVLVSFSCTAPIVGTVLVEATRGAVMRPIIGMLGFSIAVALPFGFFAFFPSKLSNLPKSGGWLNSVKVVLGFIEVALGFKFLMVADQTYHWGLLDREVYLAIWIAVFTLQALYLMGKIKFANDSELKHIGVGRLIVLIITMSFVIYLIPGMFGAPLKAVAGYLPPQTTIDFDINKIVRDNIKTLKVSDISTNGKDDSKLRNEFIKYSDFLKLPNGLDGYFDYNQALAVAQAEDKPLFIDFTGHGCNNCREMEQTVWSDPRVADLLENKFVVCALYVDDKTTLPKKEQYVSEYDGKKKRTLGKKNADFQIKKFDSNAQPNYILLDSRHGDEKDLRPVMIAPSRGHNLDVDAFLKYLQDALNEYEKRK